MSSFTLTVLGSGSAVPLHGRHPSAQLIRYHDLSMLIDCGEGTQMRFHDAGIKPFRIQFILISHLHGDHVYGLPGLISSLNHLGREQPLMIFGPVGLKSFLESVFEHTALQVRFPVEITEVTPVGLKRIWSNKKLEICTFPLDHRIACNGYLIRETAGSLKLDKAQVESARLTPDQIHHVLEESDFQLEGKTRPASDFIAERIDPVSYAYCSDTRYDRKVARWLSGVSVLYHEATFAAALEDLAKETGHSTTVQAAMIALEAGAKTLILGHYSSRYKDTAIMADEASGLFQPVIEAAEGETYDLRKLSEPISGKTGGGDSDKWKK